MKLNNKGFALTSVIYMLIALFLMTMLLILANLAQRKVVLDKLKYDVKNKLNQGIVIDATQLPYQNETTGIYFETLELAINKANSEDTIKVLKNVTDVSTPRLEEDKQIKIDLAGNTITLNKMIINNGTMDIYSTSDGGAIYSSSPVTIKNNGTFTTNSTSNSNTLSIVNTSSTIETSRIIINSNSTTLNENSTLLFQNPDPVENTSNRYIIINEGGTAPIVTVNGASLFNKHENIKNTNIGISNSTTAINSKIVFNSGTIETDGLTIWNNGSTLSTTENPAIKISGGTIKSINTYALRNNKSEALISIKDGTIMSETSRGVYITSGTIEVGTNDNGMPSTTHPSITGKMYGIEATSGTIYFYDGIITGNNGSNSAISGTVNVAPGTEIIKTLNGNVETATLRPIFVSSGAQSILDASNHGTGSTWTALAGPNATVNNGTWGTNYLQFNGTNTWVNMNELNSNYQTLEVTFSVDAYPSKNQYLISNIEIGGGGIYITSAGKVQGAYYMEQFGDYKYSGLSNTTIQIGTVYHATLTYNGTIMILYINGSQEKTLEYSDNIKTTKNNTVMALGGNPAQSAIVDSSYNGKIYSAAVYNRALTAEEVHQNYVKGMYIAGQTVN